ncbi:TPA: hypothetical protein ACH3X3_005875 [Trebouxia sp. C0006]
MDFRTVAQSSCTVKTRPAVSQNRHNSPERDANGSKTGAASAAAQAAAPRKKGHLQNRMSHRKDDDEEEVNSEAGEEGQRQATAASKQTSAFQKGYNDYTRRCGW